MSENDKWENHLFRLSLAYMVGATMMSAWLAGKGVPFLSSVFFGIIWPVGLIFLSGE